MENKHQDLLVKDEVPQKGDMLDLATQQLRCILCVFSYLSWVSSPFSCHHQSWSSSSSSHWSSFHHWSSHHWSLIIIIIDHHLHLHHWSSFIIDHYHHWSSSSCHHWSSSCHHWSSSSSLIIIIIIAHHLHHWSSSSSCERHHYYLTSTTMFLSATYPDRTLNYKRNGVFINLFSSLDFSSLPRRLLSTFSLWRSKQGQKK